MKASTTTRVAIVTVVGLVSFAFGYLGSSPGSASLRDAKRVRTSPIDAATAEKSAPIVGAPPGVVLDVRARFAAIVAIPGNLHRIQATQELGRQLTFEDLRKLWNFIPTSDADFWLRDVLLATLAKKDPQGLIAWIEREVPQGTPERRTYLKPAIVELLRRDVARGLEWLAARPKIERSQLFWAVADNLCKQGDPASAAVVRAYLAEATPANAASLLEVWPDVPAAMREALAIASPAVREAALSAVLPKLAAQDPKQAIAEFARLTQLESRRRDDLLVNIAVAIAATNPADALAFADGEPELAAKLRARGSVAISLLSRDREAALEILGAIAVEDTAKLFVRGGDDFGDSVYSQWLTQDLGGACEHLFTRLDSLPANHPSGKAMASLLNDTLRTSIDHQKLQPAEILDALVSHGSAASAAAVENIVSGWVSRDASAALAWVEQMLTGPAREAAYSAVGSARGEESVVAAAQWIESLPAGSDRNAAIGGFARSRFSQDPEGVLAWLRTVPDPQERLRRMTSAWKSWYDRAAARKWRDESPGLTAAERGALGD